MAFYGVEAMLASLSPIPLYFLLIWKIYKILIVTFACIIHDLIHNLSLLLDF